jgi:DNA replication protein DnaC
MSASKTAVGQTKTANLVPMLRALKLPAFVEHHEGFAQHAERDGWSCTDYLHKLVELELSNRTQRRIERNRKLSRLPADKTLDTLDLKKVPAKVRRQLPGLCDGSFSRRADNVLAFGLPGRGKTHIMCAIGHEMITRGYRVLFIPAYLLVQQLLAAKRDLTLKEELRRLDRFDAVILDDLGYVQQDRDEMEVLFTFLGQRYERRSVMITSNLVFSQWDRIFKDPMTTAAAIDRVVHHSIILNLSGRSIRKEQAETRSKRDKKKKRKK